MKISRFITCWSVGTIATFFIYPILQLATPIILKSVLNLKNNTYEKSLPFSMEYFVNLEEHFMIPFLHSYCVNAFFGILSNSSGTAYIISIYFIIGRFDMIG